MRMRGATNPAMNPDFVDRLRAFSAAEVRYLVVGGRATACHAQPWFTQDLEDPRALESPPDS
jgi:hypothetical protein